MKTENHFKFLKTNWILIFILLQPLLDVLAFWTQSDAGTVAGVIRLLMLAAVYCYAFLKRRTPAFLIASAGIALIFGLHILNGFRVGYTGLASDLQYIARVASMPVLAAAFAALADDEQKQGQILRGFFGSAVLTGIVIILSALSNTYMPTYVVERLGISGWVTESNRCCHSDILSSLAVFAAYGAFLTRNVWLKLLIPLLIFAALITNATTACYLTLLAISAGFPVFLILRSVLVKQKNDTLTRYVMVEFAVLFALAIVIYPYTPRCRMEELENSSYNNNEQKFVQEMADLGYDIYNMTLEEKMSDPVVHEKLTEYYNKFICNTVMSMRDRFGIDRVIIALNGTINASVLDDGRVMKRLNASFVMEDSDLLTHFTGYEFGQVHNAYEDPENDWDAIYYYYGYIGISFYILTVLYLFFRIFRLVVTNFTDSLTLLNFTLLFCFVLQLGLAGFSGALLRRPNASVYLSLVIAQIWFRTKIPLSRTKPCSPSVL
ncbi:MAG: O-antigen ligase family protein [Oscillospiraceae bacterium]|nr:O-antigen ligase family protein [Oscillospiraceae bacterium]